MLSRRLRLQVRNGRLAMLANLGERPPQLSSIQGSYSAQSVCMLRAGMRANDSMDLLQAFGARPPPPERGRWKT